jgi:hypothetical protein
MGGRLTDTSVDAKWEYQENIKQVLITTYSLFKFMRIKSNIYPVICFSEHPLLGTHNMCA